MDYCVRTSEFWFFGQVIRAQYWKRIWGPPEKGTESDELKSGELRVNRAVTICNLETTSEFSWPRKEQRKCMSRLQVREPSGFTPACSKQSGSQRMWRLPRVPIIIVQYLQQYFGHEMDQSKISFLKNCLSAQGNQMLCPWVWSFFK
jgi:hypothetical protein